MVPQTSHHEVEIETRLIGRYGVKPTKEEGKDTPTTFTDLRCAGSALVHTHLTSTLSPSLPSCHTIKLPPNNTLPYHPQGLVARHRCTKVHPQQHISVQVFKTIPRLQQISHTTVHHYWPTPRCLKSPKSSQEEHTPSTFL